MQGWGHCPLLCALKPFLESGSCDGDGMRMLGAPMWVLSSARAAPFLGPISGWLLGKKSYREDGQELARDTQGVVVSPGGVQDVALRDVICGGGVGLKDLRGLPILMVLLHSLRACPECRLTSTYYIPHKFWLSDGDEKQQLIESFKARTG